MHYTDDFGDCREGCTRHHMGNDLLGAKLMHEVAASAGTIAWVHATNSGTAGNMLQLTGNDGWVYWYIHINNDTPGTDDGKNPARWRLAPGIHEGSVVKAGQFIAYMGDSGDAEGTQPHLHFEIHTPGDTAIDPYTSLRLAQGLPARTGCATRRRTRRTTRHSPAAPGTGRSARTGSALGFGSAQTYAVNPAAKTRRPKPIPDPRVGRDRVDHDRQGLLDRRLGRHDRDLRRRALVRIGGVLAPERSRSSA